MAPSPRRLQSCQAATGADTAAMASAQYWLAKSSSHSATAATTTVRAPGQRSTRNRAQSHNGSQQVLSASVLPLKASPRLWGAKAKVSAARIAGHRPTPTWRASRNSPTPASTNSSSMDAM